MLGGKIMSEVLSETFSRLCKDLDRKKLSLLYAYLLEEMNSLLERPDGNMAEKGEKNGELGIAEDFGDGVLPNEKPSNEFHHISKETDGYQEKLMIVLSLLNNLLEFRNGKQVNGGFEAF
jgi:hypothetical protein